MKYICTEQYVISPKFDKIRGSSKGLAGVEINGKWGVINKQGKIVVAPKFDNIRRFSEGLAWVEINGKWGLIKVTTIDFAQK